MSLALEERKSALCRAVARMPDSSANLLMSAMEEVVQQEGTAAVFLSRGIRVLVEISIQAKADLPEAIASSSDYDLLLNVLQQPSISERLVAIDPLAKAKIRGILAKPQLLNVEGGCLSSDETAKLLSISREAVNKRRQHGKLIGLPAGRSYRYPMWQFHEGRTLTGLETVLNSLKVQDPWMQAAWMVNDNLRLGQSPLNLLRAGKTEAVVESACLYGEQGAS